MKNFVWAALLAVMAPSMSIGSTFVVSGEIVSVGDPADGDVSVDHWEFDVAETGIVTIDTLSYLYYDYYMDPYIYIFTDDGDLGTDDSIGANDDSGDTYGDGSVHDYDSYMSFEMSAGSYILAISAYSLSYDEAISSVNFDTAYPRCSGAVVGLCDHADYQITFSGVSSVTGGTPVIAPVPLPPAVGLLGGAVLGLGAFRRFSFG